MFCVAGLKALNCGSCEEYYIVPMYLHNIFTIVGSSVLCFAEKKMIDLHYITTIMIEFCIAIFGDSKTCATYFNCV